MLKRLLPLALVLLTACYVSSEDGAPPSSAIMLENSSGWIVTDLYVSPCGSTTWGRNQLGFEPVHPAGKFFLYDVPPGCYDLKANAHGVAEWRRYTVSIEPGETYVWDLYLERAVVE